MLPLTVGRGPVPRHRSRNPTLAGDRPPRYDKKCPLTVGRGPVPRHRACTRPCSSGSPDPDPFVIRRSQTTVGETHIGTMEIAGDRPPRYDKKCPLTVGRGPVPRHRSHNPTLAGDRPPRYGHIETMELAGDRPPRYGHIEPRGLSYRTHRNMKHPQSSSCFR